MNIILLLSTFNFNKYAFCGFKTHICLHRDILHLKQAFWNLNCSHSILLIIFQFVSRKQITKQKILPLDVVEVHFSPIYYLFLIYIELFLYFRSHFGKSVLSWICYLIPEASSELLYGSLYVEASDSKPYSSCKPSVEPQFKVLVLSLLWLLLCFIVMGQTCCPQ